MFRSLVYSFVCMCLLASSALYAESLDHADTDHAKMDKHGAQSSGEMTSVMPFDWLKKMTLSFSTLDYDGIFVHSGQNRLNSMRIRHGLIGGVEYESLEDLDGADVTLIRVDDSLICISPDEAALNTSAFWNQPFNRFKELDEERIKEGYTLKLSRKNTRIAGRAARVIKLIPKDEHRFGHAFWLDNESGFLLKHDMYDRKGRLLERTQFVSLSLNPDLKVKDFTPNKDSYKVSFESESPQEVENGWEFEWLPKGFGMVWKQAHLIRNDANMLLLSDGMATVSVFIEPSIKKVPLHVMSRGATHAAERTVTMRGERYLLTLVGEVPPATIETLMSVFMPKATQ
ncbi:MucB/RseB C-terminal domain-containing protein [Marinomonas balearica]|uniref:MucB/RseB-like sigma(E) regulatory protein n=1 Tax=Marinomonas balearica TaxID=491947 RepID=A0A4R6MF81_9GAMM|nr:MucB/RseB C-terminal domain-containing protein [Marinomonas balearica]TDP00492.1 MucB/RseB-like sigma(E) regulatory protein [Marinomonas balearica]